MNIVYLTNTFTPHVGGVARSLEAFSSRLRERGHRVLVIAPEFPDMAPPEADLIRISAIQNFNASDFSVVLPIPKGLRDELINFEAEIVHSHHPFLLGMTALRLARSLDLPLLFTHHTLYEQYIHYIAPENEMIAKFIIELATGYANLTDHVIAPSESLRQIILERGVTTPISVVPTGVQVSNFAGADGAFFRRERNISAEAFVVGHLGRLAPEKNIGFLARAVCMFLSRHPGTIFLVVGDGPCAEEIRQVFAQHQLSDRLVATGVLEGADLAAALCAMDVFAFSSLSETQGMVITEAMAAGVPVVALQAPGVCDVVRDGYNGRLLSQGLESDFEAALSAVFTLPDKERRLLVAGARATADKFSLDRSVDALVEVYQGLSRRSNPGPISDDPLGLEAIMSRLKAEWDIFKNLTHAGDEALSAGFASSSPSQDEGAPDAKASTP